MFFTEVGLDDTEYLKQASKPFSFLMLFENVQNLPSPLVVLSFVFDRYLFGDDFAIQGGHIINVLLHLVVTIILYFFLKKLSWKDSNGNISSLSPIWCGVGSLIFAIHPQRVESVAWLAERKDVLVLALGLGALSLFYSGIKKDKISIVSWILLLLSFLSKPLMISFVFVGIALIWFEKRKFDWKCIVKHLTIPLGITIVYICWQNNITKEVINIINGSNELPTNSTFSIIGKLELIFFNYGNYFLKAIMPQNLLPLYPYYATELSNKIICFIPVFLVVITGYLIAKKGTRNFSLYGLLPALFCFAMTLAPTVGFAQIGNTDYADRYSYLPSVFLIIPIIFLLSKVYEEANFKRYIVFGLSGYMILLTYLTIIYIPCWKNISSIAEKSLEAKYPNINALSICATDALTQNNIEKIEIICKEKFFISKSFNSMLKAKIELNQASLVGIYLFRINNPDEGMKYFKYIYNHPYGMNIKNFPIPIIQAVFSYGANYYWKKEKNTLAARQLYLNCSKYLSRHSIEYKFYYDAMAAIVINDFNQAVVNLEKAIKIAPENTFYRDLYNSCKEMLKKK